MINLIPQFNPYKGQHVLYTQTKQITTSPQHLPEAEAKTERRDAHHPDTFLFGLNKNNWKRDGKITGFGLL